MAGLPGWSWFLCLVIIFQDTSKIVAKIVQAQEGQSFNVSCSYNGVLNINYYWTIQPQLIDTVGEGDCTELNDKLTVYCHVNSAAIKHNGTYNFILNEITEQVYQCVVMIYVNLIKVNSSSIYDVISTSFDQQLSSSPVTQLLSTQYIPPTTHHLTSILSTTTSGPSPPVQSSTTVTTHPSILSTTTSGPSPPVQSSTTVTTHPSSSITVITPKSSSTLTIVISLLIVVGVMITLALIIISLLIFLIMRHKKKGKRLLWEQREDEIIDTGFLLGKERDDLYEVKEDDNNIPNPVSFTSIVFQELTEKGTFSLVHHATIKKTDVFVKQLRESTSKLGREELLHEIELLERLSREGQHHLNVISYVSSTASPDPPCLVVEYLPYGTLKDFLVKLLKGPLPGWYMDHISTSVRRLYNHQQISEDLFHIILQITKAIEYLNSIGVIHGHLSTANVLLGRKLLAKLCNFTTCQSGEYFKNTGRDSYLRDLAPETILNGEHSIKSDVWSFGILVYRIATFESREPFKNIKPNQIFEHISQGTRPPPFLPCYSKELYYQLQQCWKFDKEERPTFTQLLHTLEILAQSPSTHILFHISEKRCGYISDNHEIYLQPPPSHISGTNKKIQFINGKMVLSHPQSTPEDTGTTSGNVSDISTDTENDSASKGHFKWLKKKSKEEDIPISQLLINQKYTPDIEKFERNLLMESQNIERQNPLISI